MKPGVNPLPSGSELRWFGCILAAVFAWLGVLVAWSTGSATPAVGFTVAGVTLAALYYAARPLRVPLYRLWMAAVLPIGRLISLLLLGIIYFGILTPIALTLRAVGRDRMARRFDSATESYWSPREPESDDARYFRQS